MQCDEQAMLPPSARMASVNELETGRKLSVDCDFAAFTFSRPKDVIPDMQKSGVVYKIPCASCPASYIGQTGRRLQQRLDEHKRAIRQAGLQCISTSRACVD